jgi:UDP-N-acetylglucosamine--N-acetylmuramyl-(pentapeptide) pyrophosphoryl-undecaprenol N-acetylglucosamine transferase
MADKEKIVVLCAGGSGGHIFPAIAVADELLQNGYNVILFTDCRGEAYKNEKIKVYTIMGEAVSGRNLFRKCIAAAKLAFGTLQSLFYLSKIKPDAVVGFGGFASVPGCLAAEVFTKIPVILHEQNAVLGLANRVLAKKASLLITSFTKTSMVPPKTKVKYVGMPVRKEVAEMAAAAYPKLTTRNKINLLIIGGSQGAAVLSRIVPAAIKMLPESIKKRLNVCQQCRPEDLDNVRLSYLGSGIRTELASFFSDIPQKMVKAHLIISRAGSSSVAEIFTIGRPAILIPYRFAADNHQYENALSLNEKGGGWILKEDTLTAPTLCARLISLFENPDVLSNAAACALIKDRQNVAYNLSCTIMDLINDNKSNKN